MQLSMETAAQLSVALSLFFVFVGLGLGTYFTTREVDKDTRDAFIIAGAIGIVICSLIMGAGVTTAIQMEMAGIVLALSTLMAFIGVGLRISYRKPN